MTSLLFFEISKMSFFVLFVPHFVMHVVVQYKWNKRGDMDISTSVLYENAKAVTVYDTGYAL